MSAAQGRAVAKMAGPADVASVGVEPVALIHVTVRRQTARESGAESSR